MSSSSMVVSVPMRVTKLYFWKQRVAGVAENLCMTPLKELLLCSNDKPDSAYSPLDSSEYARRTAELRRLADEREACLAHRLAGAEAAIRAECLAVVWRPSWEAVAAAMTDGQDGSTVARALYEAAKKAAKIFWNTGN